MVDKVEAAKYISTSYDNERNVERGATERSAPYLGGHLPPSPPLVPPLVYTTNTVLLPEEDGARLLCAEHRQTST